MQDSVDKKEDSIETCDFWPFFECVERMGQF